MPRVRLLVVVAALTLSSAACKARETYRVGEPGAPTEAGPWGAVRCEWEDALVHQAPPPTEVQPPRGPWLAGEGEDRLREAYIAEALRDVDRNLAVARASIAWRTTCVVRCENSCAPASVGTACVDDPPPPVQGVDGGAAATTYTTTNDAVPGVNEADLLQNDAKYIHIARAGEVTTIDAVPGDAAAVVNRLHVRGDPQRVLVADNRLIVFSSAESYTYRGEAARNDERFQGAGTIVTVWDVTTRSAPVLLRTLATSDSFRAARRIGDDIHLIVERESFRERVRGMTAVSVPPRDRCVTSKAAYDEAIARLEASAEATRAALRDYSITYPATISDSAGALPPPRVYAPATPQGDQVVSLLSFSLRTSAPAARTALVGRSGTVHGGADRVILSAPATDYTSTEMHAFAIGSGPATLLGSTVLPGAPPGQLAVSSEGGYVRVATQVLKPRRSTSVFVLRPEAGTLRTVSALHDIAPDEYLSAVRFLGDRGYLVTFKEVDPLFAVDLSDPAAPKVAGELKIPGFSTYIHPVDRDHLLTIGFDTDARGERTGLQLQHVDVTQLSAPRVLHKESLAGSSFASAAPWNRFAFTYYPEKELLALPLTLCETAGAATVMTFNGLMVYGVSVAGGFQKKGGVPLPHGPDGSYSSGLCGVDRREFAVTRSVFLDDYVYAVSAGKMQIARISDLAHPVVELPLPKRL